jgi:hypothetical protein
MSESASNEMVERLVMELREIYRRDPEHAAKRIELLLSERVKSIPQAQHRDVLGKIIAALESAERDVPACRDNEIAARVFGLLLGKRVDPRDLSSQTMIENLAQSLNTIFNALNELIGLINKTFSGGSELADQTIRQVIGGHIGGEENVRPLEEYLGQINHAFVATQEAFKKAAQTKVAQILHSLDPEKIAAERSGGLKIGPLRKAEDFDLLTAKIDRIRRWFESGRFMEDFLREFEKSCQTIARR